MGVSCVSASRRAESMRFFHQTGNTHGVRRACKFPVNQGGPWVRKQGQNSENCAQKSAYTARRKGAHRYTPCAHHNPYAFTAGGSSPWRTVPGESPVRKHRPLARSEKKAACGLRWRARGRVGVEDVGTAAAQPRRFNWARCCRTSCQPTRGWLLANNIFLKI